MQKKTIIAVSWALSALSAGGCESDSAPAYDGRNPYASDENEATDEGAGGDDTSATGGQVDGEGGESGGAATAGSGTVGITADIVLLSDAEFAGYLADSDDRALYMFANDVPGTNLSSCTEACLEKWPVFDVKDISVGDGLTATDFARFLRADGAWQTTFKGHPLYYFTMDGDTAEVSGDGVGGRWFVARDYFAFLGAKADLTPEGATAAAPYLTNKIGRTSYVFMKDTVAKGTTKPVSACTGACIDSWPAWPAPPSLSGLILPSTMVATDFSQFDRDVGGTTVKQLTYRGWPLYYYTPDDLAGETSGHLSGAWRAIDPSQFAETNVPAAPGNGY